MVFENSTLEEVLVDLASRFIINIPPSELGTPARLLFQIEQAHWFYEDFVRQEAPSLPSLSLYAFSRQLLARIGLEMGQEQFKAFIDYKVRVPVCGGILLNEKCDSVLLVRGFKEGSSWSFPRGKINEGEPVLECAIREVFEETGFDMSDFLLYDSFIERTVNEQKLTMFIACGVPSDTSFITQTRKEIGEIKWFKLQSLPGYGSRNAKVPKGIKFYLVTPFMTKLKNWLKSRISPEHHEEPEPNMDLTLPDTRNTFAGQQKNPFGEFPPPPSPPNEPKAVQRASLLSILSSFDDPDPIPSDAPLPKPTVSSIRIPAHVSESTVASEIQIPLSRKQELFEILNSPEIQISSSWSGRSTPTEGKEPNVHLPTVNSFQERDGDVVEFDFLTSRPAVEAQVRRGTDGGPRSEKLLHNTFTSNSSIMPLEDKVSIFRPVDVGKKALGGKSTGGEQSGKGKRKKEMSQPSLGPVTILQNAAHSEARKTLATKSVTASLHSARAADRIFASDIRGGDPDETVPGCALLHFKFDMRKLLDSYSLK